MKTTNPLALDAQICFPLYAASRLVTWLYQPLLAEIDLTYPRYLVLLVLWENDGLPLKEIGRRLLLDSGTLTPLLRALEKQRLIRRSRDPHDGRTLQVRLTREGRALRSRAECIPAKLLARAGTSPASLRSLKKELDALLVSLRELHTDNGGEVEEGVG